MVAPGQKPELIAIVGPTASGKSQLSMDVANLYGGEIITADSRTLYKGADIGTAKPKLSDRQKIPHWGLDLVEPGDSFSAHQFKQYAQDCIADIKKRGKLPILVGGTGLYVDAILYGFDFRSASDPKEREKLEGLDIQSLQAIIIKKGYRLPVNLKNKRHLIRVIETKGAYAKKQTEQLKNALIIGLLPTEGVLRANIRRRTENMFRSGVVEETRNLMDRYGEGAAASAGIAYKVVAEHITGSISNQEAMIKIEHQDWQYVRRQRTWFKKNNDILWFTDNKKALLYLKSVLNTSIT